MCILLVKCWLTQLTISMSALNYPRLQRNNYSGSTMILMSKVCNDLGRVTIVEHKFDLNTTADAPKGRNLYCTLCIKILYFRLLNRWMTSRRGSREDWWSRGARITTSPCLCWFLRKERRCEERRGLRPRINTGREQPCMQRHLYHVSKSRLDQPSMLRSQEFLPVEAPLLDNLNKDSRSADRWSTWSWRSSFSPKGGWTWTCWRRLRLRVSIRSGLWQGASRSAWMGSSHAMIYVICGVHLLQHKSRHGLEHILLNDVKLVLLVHVYFLRNHCGKRFLHFKLALKYYCEYKMPIIKV